MKRKSYVVALTGICMVLGIIIGVQYNTVKKQNNSSELQRVSELSASLQKNKAEKEKLEETLKEKEEKIKEYEKSLGDEGQGINALKKELDLIRLYGGFTDVTGRGITVTLNDSRNASKNGGDTNAYLVHAEDILSVINECNASGAEAISINGQRIVGNSSVRCAGAIVNINGVRVAAPFVFSVIGDPTVLESALRFPGGVIDSLSPWGIEISIKASNIIEVPAYRLPLEWKEIKQEVDAS